MNKKPDVIKIKQVNECLRNKGYAYSILVRNQSYVYSILDADDVLKKDIAEAQRDADVAYYEPLIQQAREEERERIIELLNLWRGHRLDGVPLMIKDLIKYGINGEVDDSSTFRYFYQGDYMKWLNTGATTTVTVSDDEGNDNRQGTSRRSSKRGHSGKEYNRTGRPSDNPSNPNI